MNDKSKTPVPNLADYKLPAEVEALAKRLTKDAKIGSDHSANIPKEAFVDNLPEGLTIDLVRRVHKYEEDFMSGALLATGQQSPAHFEKHKTANRINLTAPMDRSKFEASIDRSKTWPARGDGDPITKFGVVSSSFTVAGSSVSRGALKKTRTYIGDLAAASIGG